MKRTTFAATGLWLVLTVLPVATFAASNVLLPSSSDDDSSSSYLGLGVPATKAPAPAAPAQAPAAQATAPAAATTAITPPTPQLTGDTKANTSAAATYVLPTVITPVDAESAAKLSPDEIPTQVIDTGDDSAIYAMMNKNLPYRMTFTINGNSLFGSNDIQEISSKLGLSRDQIPSACILTVRGMIQTDKGSYIITGPAAPQTTVNYDGMIENYYMSATALCTAGRLPPNSGILNKAANRFRIELQPIECPVPTRQSTELSIAYNGSGTSQCSYQ